jgi:hypothetical protein
MSDDFDLDKIRLPRTPAPEKNRSAEARIIPGKKRPFLCWPAAWDDQLGKTKSVATMRLMRWLLRMHLKNGFDGWPIKLPNKLWEELEISEAGLNCAVHELVKARLVNSVKADRGGTTLQLLATTL